ncbi:hypothetical protein A2303_02135 [Candidatus Falkowbacteria bacterium RIFOXYB2_FULL_47_14]|uniref:ribose-phosphate diphosphokinase n=1 Tax=Candidatus Falkowbacteria bacterium RIFOXYA2_FULL_47_19 TaxID=1797994 RepID=A0A1F5SER0_9BACT|nr:MAG: hypothetical protein A2227_07315 [Candidatus Falkowbacteria bacterium RIFOXYA2_FULL_47_19]OGF35226.1 MAG: hypothetical protein A2468_00940 [Candidatus Falkowbacteria bacterium RIFOXYC2_FULL_46_15]OGF43866.1 MAG: hypothetical protein A2303_02135 [Candidatus Falkowbacteria bacterium RIFOXYB2_FULL_47_14]
MKKSDRKKIAIFSTEASLYFAELVAARLGIPTVGRVERKIFGGGERYYRLSIDDRAELFGRTAIFVGSTNTDEDFHELYRVGCALAGYGTARRIFLIPFMGYSTMERAVLPGEIVTAKANIRILSSIPNTGLGNAFFHFDLHVGGLVHYYEGDCLRFELYGGDLLVGALEKIRFNDFMFASADLGRPLWVKYFAERFKVPDMAFVHKTRRGEETEVDLVIGDVDGKNVIIYDDMSRSFKTLIDAANAYLSKGARSVSAVLSHLAPNSDEVIKKIIASPLKWVVHTNSHPMSRNPLVANMDKFIGADISGLYANAIRPLLS